MQHIQTTTYNISFRMYVVQIVTIRLREAFSGAITFNHYKPISHSDRRSDSQGMVIMGPGAELSPLQVSLSEFTSEDMILS